MSQPHNLTPALKISNSAAIVTNRKKRASYIYRYLGLIGKGFYIVEGKYISERDFEKMFPVTGECIRRKGFNPDKTKIE